MTHLTPSVLIKMAGRCLIPLEKALVIERASRPFLPSPSTKRSFLALRRKGESLNEGRLSFHQQVCRPYESSCKSEEYQPVRSDKRNKTSLKRKTFAGGEEMRSLGEIWMEMSIRIAERVNWYRSRCGCHHGGKDVSPQFLHTMVQHQSRKRGESDLFVTGERQGEEKDDDSLRGYVSPHQEEEEGWLRESGQQSGEVGRRRRRRRTGKGAVVEERGGTGGSDREGREKRNGEEDQEEEGARRGLRPEDEVTGLNVGKANTGAKEQKRAEKEEDRDQKSEQTERAVKKVRLPNAGEQDVNGERKKKREPGEAGETTGHDEEKDADLLFGNQAEDRMISPWEKGKAGGAGGGIFQLMPTELLLCLLECHSRAIKKKTADPGRSRQKQGQNSRLPVSEGKGVDAGSTVMVPMTPSFSCTSTYRNAGPETPSSSSFSPSSFSFPLPLSASSSSASCDSRAPFPLPSRRAVDELLYALSTRVSSFTLAELLWFSWALSSLFSSPSFYEPRSSSSFSSSTRSSSSSPTLSASSHFRPSPYSLQGSPTSPLPSSVFALASYLDSSFLPSHSASGNCDGRSHESHRLSSANSSSPFLCRRSLLATLFSRALHVVLQPEISCNEKQGVSFLSSPSSKGLSSDLLARGISGLSQLVDSRHAREQFPFLQSLVLPRLILVFLSHQRSERSCSDLDHSFPSHPPLPSSLSSLKNFTLLLSACSRINLRPPQALLDAILSSSFDCLTPLFLQLRPQHHHDEQQSHAEGEGKEKIEEQEKEDGRHNNSLKASISALVYGGLYLSPSSTYSVASPRSFSCLTLPGSPPSSLCTEKSPKPVGTVGPPIPSSSSPATPSSFISASDFLQASLSSIFSSTSRHSLTFCFLQSGIPFASATPYRRDLSALLLSLCRLERYEASSFLLLRYVILPRLSFQPCRTPDPERLLEKVYLDEEELEQLRQHSCGELTLRSEAEARELLSLRVLSKGGGEEGRHDHHFPSDASLDFGNLLMACALQVGLYYPIRSFFPQYTFNQRGGEESKGLFAGLLQSIFSPTHFYFTLQTDSSSSSMDSLSSLLGSLKLNPFQEENHSMQNDWRYQLLLLSCFLNPRKQIYTGSVCSRKNLASFSSLSCLSSSFSNTPNVPFGSSTPATRAAVSSSLLSPCCSAHSPTVCLHFGLDPTHSVTEPSKKRHNKEAGSGTCMTQGIFSTSPTGIEQRNRKHQQLNKLCDSALGSDVDGNEGCMSSAHVHEDKIKDNCKTCGLKEEAVEEIFDREKATQHERLSGNRGSLPSVSLQRQIFLYCLAMRHLAKIRVNTASDDAGCISQRRYGDKNSKGLGNNNTGSYSRHGDKSGYVKRGWTGKEKDEEGIKKKQTGEGKNSHNGRGETSEQGQQRLHKVREDETVHVAGPAEKEDRRTDVRREPHNRGSIMETEERWRKKAGEGEEDSAQQVKEEEGDKRPSILLDNVTLFSSIFSSLRLHTLQGLLRSLAEKSGVSHSEIPEKKKNNKENDNVLSGRQSRLENEVVYALHACLRVFTRGLARGGDRLGGKLNPNDEVHGRCSSNGVNTLLADTVGTGERISGTQADCYDNRNREESPPPVRSTTTITTSSTPTAFSSPTSATIETRNFTARGGEKRKTANPISDPSTLRRSYNVHTPKRPLFLDRV
ncbi:hypothetical protein CSUI_006608 [Cystoisospora suis]|uniref:Uncharacterized protein n=1 Tax=Cystoisospora suis TaxID=483139 RepID=A0A2C6KTX2_9APIC|nr:hypothetical protein CSUI_006608 [Cystoisospora suis]